MCAAIAALLSACAPVGRGVARVAPAPTIESAPRATAAAEPAPYCLGCTPPVAGEEIVRALTQRVADLKRRGGVCEAYGGVLERSLTSGRIVVRPFMWRVGSNLASAQALSTGEIDVARDIDPLNSGLRTLDDVVHSMEHEAAHIAMAMPSGLERNETTVNERVAACRAGSLRVGSAP